MDLVIKGAGTIVPMADNHPKVLHHHAILIQAGRIVDIVPEHTLSPTIEAKSIVEYPADTVLMPGLVNAHTHLGLTLLRGFADDLSLLDWLSHHIWPAESKWLSPEFTKQGVALGLAELIRSGVTCINDMYFYPECTAEVCQQAGIRALLSIHCIEVPTSYAKGVDDGLAKGLETQQAYSNSLIQFSIAPHAPYTVPEQKLINLTALAQQMGLRIHIHLHETQQECDHSEQGVSSAHRHQSQALRRPLDNLHHLGLLSERVIGVHMTQLLEQEIQMVAESGMHAVHCPHSNLKLASGFCPVSKLLKAGVNVALGTDSSASNNALDMFAEMKTAAIMAKAIAKDATALPAYQALQMATLNGAKALGIARDTGSLERGKSADFIAIRFNDLESVPLYDLFSHLVYCTNRQQVQDVWVNGKAIMQNRQLLTLDETQIKSGAKHWAKQIQQNSSDIATTA